LAKNPTMASFVKDTEINLLLEDLIKEADEQLVLFCPYFKLHERLRDCLKLRMEDCNLRIIVVFGKNEEDPSKSLHKEDFEFLKSFPYVDIAYEKRLHAKYYSNEKRGLITSINLHTHSHNNNIEAGVLFNTKNFLKNITDRTLGSLTSILSDTEDLATEAHSFFLDVYKNAEKIFQKEPKFKTGFLNFSKSYTHSDIIVDKTDCFYNQWKEKNQAIRNPIGFSSHKIYDQDPAIEKGFCIRTHEKIALNPAKPLCWIAYQTWAEFGNPDFKEKYCHSCGKSYGTSFRKPLCYDCSKNT
jgi:phosphatidylserine/phosphatidylglycerophosphate/cardiolipin synthase-like enzyme